MKRLFLPLLLGLLLKGKCNQINDTDGQNDSNDDAFNVLTPEDLPEANEDDIPPDADDVSDDEHDVTPDSGVGITYRGRRRKTKQKYSKPHKTQSIGGANYVNIPNQQTNRHNQIIEPNQLSSNLILPPSHHRPVLGGGSYANLSSQGHILQQTTSDGQKQIIQRNPNVPPPGQTMPYPPSTSLFPPPHPPPHPLISQPAPPDLSGHSTNHPILDGGKQIIQTIPSPPSTSLLPPPLPPHPPPLPLHPSHPPLPHHTSLPPITSQPAPYDGIASPGLYTLAIGYHLKQNILNTLGYIIHQPIININRQLYIDFMTLKTSVQLDQVDVFALISHLPEIAKLQIGEQFRYILSFLAKHVGNCQESCVAQRWEAANIDLATVFSHWTYNPLMNGIIDVKKGRTPEILEELSLRLRKFPGARSSGYASVIFSPVIVEILQSIQGEQECLREALMGYLLNFYPFPLHDNELDMAVHQLTIKLIDGNLQDTPYCKVFFNNYNDLAMKPIELLKAVTDRILESFCPLSLKAPAKVIRRALDDKLTIPNYRNIGMMRFVAMADLGKLLDQIDLRSYPVEVVMAKDRVKEYVSKILPYIDFQDFPAYKFHDTEEALMSFLTFIQVKSPHAHLSVKASINAIKAHFQFSKGPRVLTSELLVSLIDGWMAPDLNEHIIEQAYELKLFILDEGNEIRRVLSRQHRKCGDVMQCFIKASSVLKNDEFFSRRAPILKMPQCIMYRYLNFPLGNSDSPRTNLLALLDVLNPQSYRREIVLGASRLRQFIADGKDLVPGFSNEKHCTKQETLVAYLEQAIKNTNYPREVYDSMRAIIPSVAFKIRQVRQVNVRVVHEISRAFSAPDNDEAAMNQMLNTANFMATNELVVDLILDKLPAVRCNDVVRCYNQMADLLNHQNFTTYDFPRFRAFSPELYVLNLGFDTSEMSVEKIVRITQGLSENPQYDNNELDAAIIYTSLTAHLVDPFLSTVSCNDKQVLPCFEHALHVLKSNMHVLEVKISVYQYLLSPTICDRRYCQWITFFEQGSTVLNPILEYMKHLIENRLKVIQNFHIQLELGNLLEYLGKTNVDPALVGFKLKNFGSDLERLIAFLNAISRSLGYEDPMVANIANIVNYFVSNLQPKYFTLDNLKRLVGHLERVAPPAIYCEMNNKLISLLSEEDSVGKLLRNFEVDCSTLESCLASIEGFMLSSISVPHAAMVLQIIRPEKCFEAQCKWTLGRFKQQPQSYVMLRENILEILLNIRRAPDAEVPLIIKLLNDMLLRKDRLTHLVHYIHPSDIATILAKPKDGALIFFLETLLNKYNPPEDISPSLKHLFVYLKDNTLPMSLNHETLINLLTHLNIETKDDVVRGQINMIQDLITQKMAMVNAELTKLEIACLTLDQCLRKLYEKTQNMNNVKHKRFLHQILLAPGCPIAHCPRKISVSKQSADNFVKYILERFDALKDAPGCTYHLSLDIDYVKNLYFAHGADIVTTHLLYKRKEPNIVFYVLNAILNQEKIPRELALSVSNILNFFTQSLAPTYIHMYHFNNIANQLQSQAQEENVKTKFITIIENLEIKAPEINELLFRVPVNCTTYKSCLISLYLRLLKENKTGLVQYLIEMFAPIGCNDIICPWLIEFPSKHVEQVKFEIMNQLTGLEFTGLSLQLRADIEILTTIVQTETLDDIYGILGVQGNINLVPFLEALGTNLLLKYDASEYHKDMINYITKQVVPSKLRLNGLRVLAEMFYNLTTDSLIKNDILAAMNDLTTYHNNVKTFLNKLVVDCTDLSLCIQGIYDNLHVYKNDPMSVIIKNLLFPQSCTKLTCPWILEESIEISLEKLRNIKNAMTQLVDSSTLPLIISIELENVKNMLKLENTKDILPVLDLRKPGFLVDFLVEMQRSPYIAEDDSAELINLINYFKTGAIPDKLTLRNYHGLVKTVKRLTEDVLVIYELTQLEKKAERYPKVLENILSNCPVECIKLPTCIDSLQNCLLTIKSPYAKIMLEQICPLKTQDERCSRVDYSKETLLFPGKFFHPNQLIIFVNTDDTLRHATLDLTDQETIIQLSELPPIETFNSQIALLEFRDSTGINRRITIDLNNKLVLERILGMSSRQRPTINFGSMTSTVVYIPTENGKLIPIKLDHSIPYVREGIKQLVRYQIPIRNTPELQIIDLDGARSILAIDVNNNALWKSLLKLSSDSVHIDTPFLLMFPGKYGNSWKSVVITDYDRNAINTLQNLPTFNEVNTVESILGVTGGIVQLCFNVFDYWVSSTLAGISRMTRLPIVQISEIKSLVLGVPDRLGNLVPIRVDLNDSRYIEALVKTSQQLACTTGCQPTVVIQTDSESIPLHFNFDNPLALFILVEELRAVDKMEMDQNFKVIVIQDTHSKEFIILNPENYLVAEWLEDLSRIPDNEGDRYTMFLEDGSSEITVAINRNNPLVMQYLKRLMEKTLVPIPPTEVVGGDGRRYLVLTVLNHATGKLVPVVIELNPHNIALLQGISQPYNTAAFEIIIDHSVTIKLAPNEQSILEILTMLKQGVMTGIASKTQEGIHSGDVVAIPIMTKEGKDQVLFFETRKPNVYKSLKETCNDTSEHGRSIVLTRPLDGQKEVIYCNLNEGNRNRLKREAGRIKEKLTLTTTIVMTIPDKTGMLHPFILDLNNMEVIQQLRYFHSTSNVASENQVAIDYTDREGNTEIFILDLNQVTIEDFKKMCSLTPSNIVPIQKTINNYKLIVASYVTHTGSGQLILNISDSRTQEILTAISEPANPLASKISIGTDFGKIDLFIDFEDLKHLSQFQELATLTPLIPAPLLIKRPHGTLQFNQIDQVGRTQTIVLNVTDLNVLESLEVSPNKPKLSIIDSEGALRVVTIDIENQQWTKVGSTIYKAEKNTIAVINTKSEHPIVLDLTQSEIREVLKLANTGNVEHTSIVLPSINDQRNIVYVDLQDHKTQVLLKEAQMLNVPNLYPTIIPTFEANHFLITFTLQVDDKKTRPILIDNSDFDTIKKLIEVSDKSNPSSKLVTITDSNYMTYPLYLDLNNMNIQQILVEATHKVELTSTILMNTDQKVEKYLQLPFEKNHFAKCDLTNPSIIKGLLEMSTKNQQQHIGTIQSIVNPITRESIILTLDLHSPESVRMITNLCEGQVFVQPNPGSTLVVHVKNEGNLQPIILNLESELTQELLENLNEVQPSKEGTLVQFVDKHNNLKVYKIDFQNIQTQQTLKQFTTFQSTKISPTIVNTAEGQQALILSVVNRESTNIQLYISLDNTKVFNVLQTMSNQQDINATPIVVTDTSGMKKVFHINLENQSNLAILEQLSWESSDKNVSPILPTTIGDRETTIAVLDTKGRVVLFTLDLTNPWVLQTVADLSVTNSDKPTISITVPSEQGSKIFNLDTSNDKMISLLETVSSSQEFKSNPGDLIVLSNAQRPIILDVANEATMQTLIEISQATTITNATHMFVTLDREGNSQLMKLNMEDTKVLSILDHLGKLIPYNLKPTVIMGPGEKSYSAFTILDTEKQSHSFVLDVTSTHVQTVLSSLVVEAPIKPFEIAFKDSTGRTQTVILESSNQQKFLEVLAMAQQQSVIPSVPLKNLVTDAGVDNKLLIPVVQENGNLLQYTFDLSNQQTVNQLIQLSTSTSETALTMYVHDQKGVSRPIRLDLSSHNVLENLQLLAEDISAAYTFKTALTFVVNVNGKKEFIILDKDDKRMVDAFVTAFASNTVTTTNATIFNLIDDGGNTIEIKLDLCKSETISILKTLQNKYTPKVIKPFPVKLPNGQLPLVVFSFKHNRETLSVALDMNNGDVVDALKKLHVEASGNKYFAIQIPGQEGVNINIEDSRTIEQLLQLSQFTNMQETPLFLPSSDIVFTILDHELKSLKIQLDTKDQLVLQELIDISKKALPHCNCFVTLITDNYGSTIPIRIDTTNHDVVWQLINLAKRFIYPKRFKVIPKTGYVPLQVFDIPINTFSFPITIDCNNGSVLNMINQQMHNLKPGLIPTKIMACEQKGIPPILINMEDKNLPVFLTGISVLSPVILNAIIIITKPGDQPLLNMLIEVDYGQAAVTLDLNNEVVIDRLQQHQPSVHVDVTTLFYVHKGEKKPLYLNLKDLQTLATLKEITMISPIRLIPVMYKQPILVIQFQNLHLRLDLSNPLVTSQIESIGAKQPEGANNLVYMEFPSKYNLPRPVYIDLGNVATLNILKQLSMYTPPTAALVLPNRKQKVVLPSTIVRGPSAEFPLALFYVVDFGPVCVDLNQHEVKYLAMPFMQGVEPENPTYVMIPHVSGDVFILRLDLSDPHTLMTLTNMTGYCQVYYEPLEDLNTHILAITLPKKVIHLALNRTDVLEVIKELSLSSPEAGEVYIIYLEVSRGVFATYNIDISDQKTQEALYNLERPKLPPFLFEIKYQDLDMSVWKIVIDVNNYEIMDQLVLFSEVTTTKTIIDSTQIITLKLVSPQGRQFDLKLDKTNPQTLQILKEITLKSTTIEALLLIKPKPKNIQYIEVADQSGSNHQIAIDVNNLSVLRKLQQIVDSQEGEPKQSVSFKMPDGSTRQVHIDISDSATIENLLKLSMESERGIPAQLVRIRPPKRVIPILMAFPITAPFVGSFSVTVDVGKLEIVERLRALAAEYVPGRSEFELALRDREGREIVVKLDLANSTTLYKLVMLTIDSTGHNPTGIDPIEILHHVIYVPDIVTVEIPDGYENIPISFDRNHPQAVAVLKNLPNDTSGHGSSWELLENKVPISITIDSMTVRSQMAMRSVGIQTLLPYSPGEKTRMFGLFFLQSPILIDLAKREVVVSLMKLVRTTQRTPNDVFFQVRDDYSQFVTIGLDLHNPTTAQTVMSLGVPTSPISVDARKVPYLIICLPRRCIKIKTKLGVLDQMETKLSNQDGATLIQILDAYNRNRNIYINPTNDELFNVLAHMDNAAFILQPLTINMMVIYLVQLDEATPTYVDLTNPKVMDLLHDLDSSYNQRQPLGIVCYLREGIRNYFMITMDAPLIDTLSKDTAIVSGHSIIKQKPWQQTTIKVPSTDGTSISIVLDMADKEVVQSLKDISAHYEGTSPPRILNFEDAYGFPFQVKLNIHDEKTIGQLIRLSNKQRIV